MSPESPTAKKPRTKAIKTGTAVDEPPVSLALRLADWALIGAFLALTFLLGVFPLKDTDFWWHLRTGDLIRQTGQIPHTDLYTYTVPEAPWIDLHWGFQVAVSWLYARGGVFALNLAKCVITCIAVLLLVTARRRAWPIWAILLAWLPALLVLGGRMYVRPETLSLFYLSVFLAVISRWDRFPWLALALPFAQVGWVNTQGLFVFGPIVLAFGLIDAALRPGAFAAGRKRWWQIIGAATVLTGLACLVNPYGIHGALYPLQLAETMRNPIFSTTIAELTPIPLFIKKAGLRNLPLQLHIVTMVLGGLSFLIPMAWAVSVRLRPAPKPPEDPPADAKKKPRKKKELAKAAAKDEPLWRLSPLRVLLFAAFSLLSWQATRNSHQFAAVVGTVTAWNFGEWAAAVRRRRSLHEPASTSSVVAPRLVVLAGIATLFILVASGRFYAWAGEGRTIGLGEQPLWYPHEAVKFAGRLDMPPKFLAYHIGHASLYDYYHGPERKVFADARLEVIGPALYERYMDLERRIESNDPSWERALDEAGRPAVLADNALTPGVASTLLASSRWRCVWFDPIATVFVHEAYSGAVKAHAVDFGARHFRPDPTTEPQGTAAFLASAKALAQFATMVQAHGRADLARSLVLLGLGYGRRVKRADPEGLDGWKVLGQLESAREPSATSPIARYRLPFDPALDLSTVRATYAFRRALEAAPDDFTSLFMLAGLFEQSRGMGEAALPLYERMLALHPINLTQVMVQEKAETARAQVLARIGPEPPTHWENLSELDRIVTDQLNRGRAATAAGILERAYPNEARPWPVADRLATLRLHLGEPARARALWSKAASPPSRAVVAARVALTHLVEGDEEAARQLYREALALDPNLFEAHYELAVLEQDDGRADDAVASARKALETAPNSFSRSATRTILGDIEPYATQVGRPTAAVGSRQQEGGLTWDSSA